MATQDAVLALLHDVIEVLAGRKNLTPDAADAHHEALTPGYTQPKASPEQLAAAQQLLAAQQQRDAYLAAQQAAATPPPPPAGEPAAPAEEPISG